jgi:hypothetical protein
MSLALVPALGGETAIAKPKCDRTTQVCADTTLKASTASRKCYHPTRPHRIKCPRISRHLDPYRRIK